MSLLKRLIAFFGGKKTSNIDSIIAPINRIIADLDAFVQARNKEVYDAKEQIENLRGKIDVATADGMRAWNLHAKFADLTGAVQKLEEEAKPAPAE